MAVPLTLPTLTALTAKLEPRTDERGQTSLVRADSLDGGEG